MNSIPDYTGKPFSSLPFVRRAKRGSKEPSSNWAVSPAEDYGQACRQGKEYARHFIQWLRQNPEAPPMLALIVRDMDTAIGTDESGYRVAFLEHLESLLLGVKP